MTNTPLSPVPGRVSVLVLTYNQQDFVRDTIASIRSQTYRDLEIVVADDGSTDATPQLIQAAAAADARIVPVLSPANRGIPGNFNAGLARCTGEFIAYLGGDDLMLPTKIEKQVDFLRAHPECVVCVHDLEVFDSVTNRRLYFHSERFGMAEGGVELELSTNWSFGLLGKQPKSLQSAQMVRASAMPAHGFDERLRHLNDWLHGIEVLRAGRRGYVREVLGRYRRHDRQVSAQVDDGTSSFEEFLVALAIVAGRYPDLAPRTARVRRWLIFQRALYRWDRPERRKARERQLRIEAGLLPWIYMHVMRALLASRWVLGAARPIARALRTMLRPGAVSDSASGTPKRV
jgi:glycosyltransferase involved in cell wall biosynthesis